MSLDLHAPLEGLRGAEYNPRKITEEDRAALRESVRELGVVKPIIATKAGLIVAGHQRTQALRAEGVTRAPVFWLEDASEYDAARFNQLHNGTDLDQDGVWAAFSTDALKDLEPRKLHVVESDTVTGAFRGPGATVRNAIANLIKKHGPWGAVVATQSGRVIHCAQYALASALSLDPITVFVIEDRHEDAYREKLGRAYGVFSYDHLKRHSYIQSEAQLNRLKKGAKRQARSWLWEKWVEPYMDANPSHRILDFGCGRGEYVEANKGRWGVPPTGLEFFNRADLGANHGAEKKLDVTGTNRMVDQVLAECEGGRRYDVTVCDSVLNSVDHIETEAHVMNCLNLFTKMSGVLFLSGRGQDEIERKARATKASTGQQGLRIFYPDENGLTATLREGVWFFQRFHTDEQIADLLERHGFEPIPHPWGGKPRDKATWQRFARKVAEVPEEDARAAVEHEFNMPISKDGRTLGRHEDALRVLFD